MSLWKERFTRLLNASENATPVVVLERRAMIEVLAEKGSTPKEIFEQMPSVLQDSVPSHTMVQEWALLFQQGRKTCEDEHRPGRPVTVVTEKKFQIVRKLEVCCLVGSGKKQKYNRSAKNELQKFCMNIRI